MNSNRAADFLQFALRLYSRPGMKDECLGLQKGAGLNVNCLLLAAWGARLGMKMDGEAWAAAVRRAAPVREAAVAPVRAVRLQVSRDARLKEELRAGLKRLLLYAELRAEQAEERELHEAMMAYGRAAEAGGGLLRENLAAYAPGVELERFARLVEVSGLLGEGT